MRGSVERLVGLVLFVLPLFSCATITTGTHEEIKVSSSPSQARAALVCETGPAGEGTTPITFTIHRNAGDCKVTLRKEGFEPQEVLIEQGVNPAYWSNMIFAPVGPAGLFIGVLGDSREQTLGAGLVSFAAVVFSTDFWTGAVHTHRPRSVDAVLKAR
jgi:hypothetical protein